MWPASAKRLMPQALHYAERNREGAYSNKGPDVLISVQQVKFNMFPTEYNPVLVMLTACHCLSVKT
jgi:hypothetical protein